MSSRRGSAGGRGPREGRPPGLPHHPPGPPHRFEHDISSESADEPPILNDTGAVTVNGNGDVTLAAGKRCIWHPSNGADSRITVRNGGRLNALTCDITGAPPDITATGPDGASKPLNQRWKIPPNMPTADVTASGDFQAKAVTIINISDPETPCRILMHVSGS